LKDIILFPFGGNSREAVTCILAQNTIKPTWNILGYVDDNSELLDRESGGCRVLGGIEILKTYPSSKVLALPGSPLNYLKRKEIILRLNVAEDRFETVIDPSSNIAPDSQIGINTLIMGNVTISCSAVIGDHCVILPNTVVSHDSIIGDYSLVGSNVSISGSCNIGNNCYIGSGSRLKENIEIGNSSLVGIGTCVVRDVPGGVTVVGNPARKI
jgi:sugar O-acyltransferase (sialic acid O-acetyltransferase NeuD family)